MRKTNLVMLVALVCVGCHGTHRPGGPEGGGAPLFRGMGPHARKVTTSSDRAQRYFNQALTWTYAFNHDEAIRSYQEVARLDPNCAMAWWGVALCNGPHINYPMMSEAQSQAAHEAIQKALALKSKVSPLEGEVIDALARRYADPPPTDRRSLDEAYAAAMGEVWARHRGDADIGTLYAESLMDLQPWDLWAHDGQAKGKTQEILATLEEVLKLAPEHPGATHLYIHAVEASPHPEKGMAAADVLRKLVPASGHLVHMPGHIDVRTGYWNKAALTNLNSIEADRRYRKISPRQGFYRFYMAHNQHFLAFVAMMDGRYDLALKSARGMLADMPESFVKEQAALADPVAAIVPEVMMRFGKWDDILAEPQPPAFLPISNAFWHFTRGVAYAAKGQLSEAQTEQEAMRKAIQQVPQGALMVLNPAHKVLPIADHVLSGEIAYRAGRTDEAVSHLREAAALEDQLMYMEPPDWIQPVRHTLGAVLVDAGRYAEAEKVYREDLSEWPENGWSLHGLAECLKAQGSAEYEQVEARFKKAWSRADVKIGSSCLCVNKKAGAVAAK